MRDIAHVVSAVIPRKLVWKREQTVMSCHPFFPVPEPIRAGTSRSLSGILTAIGSILEPVIAPTNAIVVQTKFQSSYDVDIPVEHLATHFYARSESLQSGSSTARGYYCCQK